ncbi:MAG: nucleoside recognition domain-containing protein [Veillonellales bacterium]
MALMIWVIVILMVFFAVGCLSAKIIPGERSPFYLEIPPLRLPVLSNIITKAFTRMSWYFIEILPVFIFTSLVLWVSDCIGLLSYVIQKTEPIMILLGLPRETSQIFLLGFFRRDYGAAGLYDMCVRGLLTDNQLVVAAVTLTLFLPCVAQLAVMIKERGLFSSLIMVILIIGIAFLTGGLLGHIIDWLSIQI